MYSTQEGVIYDNNKYYFHSAKQRLTNSPHPPTPSSSWHMAGVALFACERIGLCTSWGITGVCEWADWEPGCLGWVWIRCFSVRLHARCDGTEWMERLSKSWGNNDWRDDRFESRLSSPLELRRWFAPGRQQQWRPIILRLVACIEHWATKQTFTST